VVLDTCHLHVSGFDLAAGGAPERLADEIISSGCAEYLRAIHLNDAREACGSHRDRHSPPGKGTIGEGLRAFANFPMFANLPAIMEISISDVPDAVAFMTRP
jgi:deoxyribonuclease-4